MKNLLISIIVLFIFTSQISLAQWHKVSNDLPDEVLTGWAIDAVEDCAIISIRYMIEPGVYPDTFCVFKTTDNGISWAQLKPPFFGNNEVAVDISIVDQYNYRIATDEGRILSSNDGGASWQVEFYNSNETTFMNYIEMFNKMMVF